MRGGEGGGGGGGGGRGREEEMEGERWNGKLPPSVNCRAEIEGPGDIFQFVVRVN